MLHPRALELDGQFLAQLCPFLALGVGAQDRQRVLPGLQGPLLHELPKVVLGDGRHNLHVGEIGPAHVLALGGVPELGAPDAGEDQGIREAVLLKARGDGRFVVPDEDGVLDLELGLVQVFILELWGLCPEALTLLPVALRLRARRDGARFFGEAVEEVAPVTLLRGAVPSCVALLQRQAIKPFRCALHLPHVFSRRHLLRGRGLVPQDLKQRAPGIVLEEHVEEAPGLRLLL